MIKKKISYLLLFVIGFMFLTANVNATQACENDGGSGGLSCYKDNNGQYHFSYGGQQIFCVSKGLGAPTNIASDCTVEFVKVSGIDGMEYITARDALRSALKLKAYNKGQELSKVNANGVTVEFDSSVTLEKGTTSFPDETTAEVEIRVNTKYNVTLSTNNGTFKGVGTSIEVPAGTTDGVYVLVLKGKFGEEDCSKVEAQVKASYNVDSTYSGSVSGTADVNGTGKAMYFIKCPSKKQDFIAPLNTNISIPTTEKDKIKETVPYGGSTAQPYAKTLDISVSNCDCHGESNAFCANCDTNDKVIAKDTTKNLVECANKDGFTDYCGNSIEMTAGLEQANAEKYCRVYCIEEIEYSLPGNIKTKAGRYFKLIKGWDIANVAANGKDNNYSSDEDKLSKQVTITGKRTCFSSKINKDKYIDDIKGQEQAVIRNYNLYKEDLAKAAAYKTAKEDDKASNTECDPNGWVTDAKGRATCKTYCKYKVKKTETVKYTQYSDSFDPNNGQYTGSTSEKEFSEEWISGKGGCTNVTVDANNDNKTEAYYLASAKSHLEAARTASANIKKYAEAYKQCSKWSNTYCYNPKVYFEYDEPYGTDPKTEINGYLERVDKYKGKFPGDKAAIPYASVDEDTYTPNSDPETQHKNWGSEGKNSNYVYVDKGSTVLNTAKKSGVNINIRYAKNESDKITAIFKEATKNVVTYHPYGTIGTGSCRAGEDNCRELGYVLPVALQHEGTSGLYNYNLKIENIGVPGNAGAAGNECSLDATYNRINGECRSGDSLVEKEAKDCPPTYTCNYETTTCVNCPVTCECPKGETNCNEIYKGENKICYWDIKKCPECKVDCVGCIWNNGDTTISYKTISLSKVFKTTEGEKVPSNWTDEVTPNASEVIKHIEKEGESIFDPSYYTKDQTIGNQKIGGKKSYYKIVINATVGGKVRHYNSQSSGYANDTLTCKDKDGKTICESRFLRELLPKYGAKVELPDLYK